VPTTVLAFDGSHLFNVAFDLSLLVTLLMAGGVVWYAKRRPVGTPMSWGEAMLAAAYAFFGMLLAYGVVPHQFLTWADNELKWRPDKFLHGPALPGAPDGIFAKLPMDISYQTLRDFLVVGLYIALLALQIALWAIWQGRGKKASTEVETTAFGRPLVKQR
jgi:hypothetical protein